MVEMDTPRGLKRKASQSFDLNDLDQQQHHSQKAASLHSWLAELPSPSTQEQSDPPRLVEEKPEEDMAQLPSPNSATARYGLMPPPPVPLSRSDYAPSSAASREDDQIFTEPPEGSESQSSALLKRVHQFFYRDDLERQLVFIDPLGDDINPEVGAFVSQILGKDWSYDTDQSQVEDAIRQVFATQLATKDESSTRTGILSSNLFPSWRERGSSITSVEEALLTPLALPQPSPPALPIATPKPDILYGLERSRFDSLECEVMRQRRMWNISRPNPGCHWPFFSVEFKSVSKGGTSWVAENQNAGTGALMVNSMETLLGYRRTSIARKQTDSVAFSTCVDINVASLWIHWCSSTTPAEEIRRITSSKIGVYSFFKLEDIRAYRSDIRHIFEWALTKRLTLIKQSLNDLDSPSRTRSRSVSSIGDGQGRGRGRGRGRSRSTSSSRSRASSDTG